MQREYMEGNLMLEDKVQGLQKGEICVIFAKPTHPGSTNHYILEGLRFAALRDSAIEGNVAVWTASQKQFPREGDFITAEQMQKSIEFVNKYQDFV